MGGFVLFGLGVLGGELVWAACEGSRATLDDGGHWSGGWGRRELCYKCENRSSTTKRIFSSRTDMVPAVRRGMQHLPSRTKL